MLGLNSPALEKFVDAVRVTVIAVPAVEAVRGGTFARVVVEQDDAPRHHGVVEVLERRVRRLHEIAIDVHQADFQAFVLRDVFRKPFR